MSEDKKYYWLKLKEDFFRQPEIKKLRKIAGGDTYTIIYLKMQLLSLKKEGRLYFTGLEENFIEEVALEIDEETENVSITIQYLVKCGLLETLNENEFLLNKASLSMGSETQGAERVRKFRERKKDKKVLLCNATVTNSNTEIELEKEKEIEKYIDIKPMEPIPNKKGKKKQPLKTTYAEFVNMTEIEYNKLVIEYGEMQTKKMIEVLDNYKGSSNKTYASDYRAILSWVVGKVNSNTVKVNNPMRAPIKRREEM